MISLSSLLETTHRIPNLDYSLLFQVIYKFPCVDMSDLYEAYKRMCFNVFYGNKDDHGKNFAFVYNETKKGYELSPMYDITKTTNEIEHQMSVMHKGNPTEADLLEVARVNLLDLDKCQKIIAEVKSVLKIK